MRRIVLLSVLSLLSLAAMASDFAFREGDIVFRSGKNYPVMYISGSTITHCGIIVNTSSGLQVLEAVGPVKLTPIDIFFGKNIDRAEKWTKRVTDKKLHVDYKKYLGKRYDNQFSLDNNAYYCSELVYVIFKEQFCIELSKPRPLRSYNTLGLRKELKRRKIDLDQLVITPADLYKDYSYLQASALTIIKLPDGKLSWTTEKPKNAKMCVPAAFTDQKGRVEGEYRQNGIVCNPNRKLKVSVGKGTFFIDRKWHTDTGFQQLVLVYNNKATSFKDDRKYVRRALCKNDGRTFLVESRHRMTLTEFAQECAKVSSNAVYLDMGEYGYGYVGNKVLSPWAFFSRKKQTNWLCVV